MPLNLHSYIYMQNFNEISQVIFSILYTILYTKQEESARERALCQLTESF